MITGIVMNFLLAIEFHEAGGSVLCWREAEIRVRERENPEDMATAAAAASHARSGEFTDFIIITETQLMENWLCELAFSCTHSRR